MPVVPQPRDGVHSESRIDGVALYPDTSVPEALSRSQRRASASERIEHHTLAERQDGTDDLAHERLRPRHAVVLGALARIASGSAVGPDVRGSLGHRRT